MSEQPPRGRYLYTPAELSDLSYSPLVAPPANFVKIAESDLPGPSAFSMLSMERPVHGPSRRGRNGPTSGQSTRRQDRRWNAGGEISEHFANSHFNHGHGSGSRENGHRYERGSRNPGRMDRKNDEETVDWLDITPDSSSGFGGFEDGVAEFEKWKASQRSQGPNAEARKADNKSETKAEIKAETKAETKTEEPIEEPKTDFKTDSTNIPEETSSHKPQPGSKDLWESAISLPQQGSSNSRFSTFFNPAEDMKPQTSAIGTVQSPQRPLSQQRNTLGSQGMTPLSQPLGSLGSQGYGSQGRPSIASPLSRQSISSPQGLGQSSMTPSAGMIPGMHPGMGQQAMGPPGMGSGMGPPGMAPAGMNPSRMGPPPGMAPAGMDPSKMGPPPGMAPAGMNASKMGPPPGMAPAGMNASKMGPPPGMAPAGMNASKMGPPPGMAPAGMSPSSMGPPPGLVPPGMGYASNGGPQGTPYRTVPARSPPVMSPQSMPPSMQRVAAQGAVPAQGADDAFFSGLLSRR